MDFFLTVAAENASRSRERLDDANNLEAALVHVTRPSARLHLENLIAKLRDGGMALYHLAESQAAATSSNGGMTASGVRSTLFNTNNSSGLLGLPDVVLEQVALLLHDAHELLPLAMTCKNLRSTVEFVAQTFIDSSATEHEKSNLPLVNLSGRKWGVIAKYQQILKHRESLGFDLIVGGIHRKEGGRSQLVIRTFAPLGGFGVSHRIMRSGTHKAVFDFDVMKPGRFIGIARPMNYKDITQYRDCISPRDAGITARYPPEWLDQTNAFDRTNTNVVLIHCLGGRTTLVKGRQRCTLDLDSALLTAFDTNARFGLVLDMDAGTLTLYRNGNPVKEVASRLHGEFVWVAQLESSGGNMRDASIKMSEWSE